MCAEVLFSTYNHVIHIQLKAPLGTLDSTARGIRNENGSALHGQPNMHKRQKEG